MGSAEANELVTELQSRMHLVDGWVVVYKELPTMTPESAKIFLSTLEKKTAHLDHYALLVDVIEAGKPDAEVRETLQKGLRSSRLVHLAVAVHGSFLFRAGTRFALTALYRGSWSVHDTVEDALAHIRSRGFDEAPATRGPNAKPEGESR